MCEVLWKILRGYGKDDLEINKIFGIFGKFKFVLIVIEEIIY